MNTSGAFCIEITHVDGSNAKYSDTKHQMMTHYWQNNMDQKKYCATLEKVMDDTDGMLAIFTDDNHVCQGFLRLFRQPVMVNNKKVIVYWTISHFKTAQMDYQGILQRIFADALKFKLTHPEDELVFVGPICQPEQYDIYNQYCSNLYPQPGKKTSHQIEAVMNALIQANDWHESSVVNVEKGTLCSFENPKFIYVPLSLIQISYVLKGLVSQNDNHFVRDEVMEEDSFLI